MENKRKGKEWRWSVTRINRGAMPSFNIILLLYSLICYIELNWIFVHYWIRTLFSSSSLRVQFEFLLPSQVQIWGLGWLINGWNQLKYLKFKMNGPLLSVYDYSTKQETRSPGPKRMRESGGECDFFILGV